LFLPKDAYHEALNIGSSNLGIQSDPFMDEEKDSIFEIISNSQGQACVSALEELCGFIEKTIFGEDKEIEFQNNDLEDRHFDLDVVDLGLESEDDDEQEEVEDQNENPPKINKLTSD